MTTRSRCRRSSRVCEAEADAGAAGTAVTLKAVVHCQGSISFMMAVVAGWIDARVTHIVSSAVSLFIDVTESTWLKQRLAMPLVARTFTGLDAQWGIRPTTPTAGLFAAAAKRMERPLWQPDLPGGQLHVRLGLGRALPPRRRQRATRGSPTPVHEWTGPRGRLHAAEPDRPGGRVKPPRLHRPLPHAAARDPAGLPGPAPPRTRAQVTFIAGDHNNMFRWQGQHRAARFFDESVGPGQADFVVLPGFGHLDTFWARDALTVSVPGHQGRSGVGARHAAAPSDHGAAERRASRCPRGAGRFFSRG